MKKSLSFLFILICLASCTTEEWQVRIYTINEPVFASKSEFRNSVKITDPVSIENQGKMCYYQGFLYISDPGKGIHIVNNNDPVNPQIVAYIELVGNNDISIKDNILYADALIDLVWFDISDPAQPKLGGRLEDVFDLFYPNTNNEYACDWSAIPPDFLSNGDMLIVGWEQVQRNEKIDNDWYYENDGTINNGGGGSQGVNGSMSRFGVYNNYLYTVINNTMNIFRLSGDSPQQAVEEEIYIGFDVETIFPYKNYMFMGTPSGLLIYSVENPIEPTFCSMISHVYGCDPVVVEDDVAYVTIHSGNACGQNANELIIIDVSDVYNPRDIVTYKMTHPKGLGIDNGILFVCDDGLKVFKDAKNPIHLMTNKVAHFENIVGYDVIPYNKILMMIAEDGLYQYDYSDLTNIRLISVIGKQ
jgi:Uncharacterized conserved protein